MELLNAKKVAVILGISRDGVYRLIREGKLKAVRISKRRIRINTDMLSKFMRGK
jgi:excisionase family DNA binding protein